MVSNWNSKMRKKYLSETTRYNFMQNSKMSIIRNGHKTIQEGWTKEQFEKAIQHIFDSETFLERLTNRDQATLFAFKESMIEYINFTTISLYKINDKLYTINQIINGVDGLEPSMASTENHGFYHKMPNGSFKLFY